VQAGDDAIADRDRFLSELIGRLPAAASVLDLGCGAGVSVTQRFAERFAVTGVDISAQQLRLAGELVAAASFLCADLHIAGWLKPGGWFLASLGANACPDVASRWLGVEMFFSSHDAATNRLLIANFGLTIELDEVVAMREPEGEVTFLWVLAQRR
jgi:hypothetical protein